MQGKDDAYQKDFHQGTIEGRILGEDHFAEEALIKAAQKVVRQATLDRVLQVVCEQYKVCQADLASSARQRRMSEPRAIAALIVREAEHLSLTSLARRLSRDLSGLSQAASRLDKRLKTDTGLTEKIEAIKERI